MRKTITIILIACLCFAAHAGNRQTLYRQFGPVFLEAMVRVIKDEINILRAQHGLAARTDQQLVDALEAKLATIPEYDWMTDPNN